MRCLPTAKLPLSHGRTLHDWHAETVARRAFNLYLFEECKRLALRETSDSPHVRLRSSAERSDPAAPPFALKDDVRIHFYTSEAPCGDASMELTMAAQADASPWPDETPEHDRILLNGRGHFSRLGVVRRKPSRADAPLSLSKSCSDKMAMWQCLSLLGGVTSLLIHPGNAYIHELVVQSSRVVQEAFERAFGSTGRMKGIVESTSLKDCKGGYDFRPFRVAGTREEFRFSKTCQGGATDKRLVGSNTTAMYTPFREEVLIGGTLQGNKQFSTRGASAISRVGLWTTALSLAKAVGALAIADVLSMPRYEQVKTCRLLAGRRAVKDDVRREALCGWVRNVGDDAFGLEGA